MDPAPVPRAPTSIGDLPNDVLIKIMSYLTSREAVHTCLLAKYWRDLWRSVPSVNVSIQEFETQEEGENEDDSWYVEDEDLGEEDGEDGEDDEDEVVFKRFVNCFLELRKPVPLDEFRLTYSVTSGTGNTRNSRDANRWINYALQCKARSVQVVNRYYALLLIVPEMFTSTCLNRLHISSAELAYGFFKHLQIGCPALEHLFIYDCIIEDLEIFSSTLKVLILSDEVYFSSDDDEQPSISASSLSSISIQGLSGARLPILTHMPSLKTASVSFVGNIATLDADGLRQFLGGLSDVTSLEFGYWDTKLTMKRGFLWCPTFRKLVHLTLDCSFVNDDFYGLIVLLQNSPNLKKLTLKLGKSREPIAGELEDRSFTCELDIVEIICLGGSEKLERVTWFLRANGITDSQMHIKYQSNV